MKRFLFAVGCLALLAAVLCAGLAGGIALDRTVLARLVPLDRIRPDAEDSFRLMAEAWNLIDVEYVDPSAVSNESLAYGAIVGMVDSLGDTGHSRFLSPDLVAQEQEELQGEYEGIGVYIEVKEGRVVVVAPIDGTPAQQAGLRPGDAILKVDGYEVSGLDLSGARRRILGPAGSEVTLTIGDADTGQTREVTLVRARIKLQNVVWERLPGTKVAHVRVVAFSQNVAQDLSSALSDLQQQGLRGAILDLRNNPGGLLDEAIGVASQFLASGNVLIQRDSRGRDTPLPVREGGVAVSLPLVVLVNQGSASAAEIVAGALQDARRALLVGETTFGTGTVLNQFGLSDGSALLLATQQWLTPSGREIWHQGIEPDVHVELPDGTSPLLPGQEKDMTPAQLLDCGDTQLLEALRVLQAGQ